MGISIKLLEFNSTEHQKLIHLRQKILRTPLGLKFSKEDLENEITQHHFAYFNEKGNIAGGFILVIKDINTLKMRQVCVAELDQGKGIGKQMMLFAEKWALKKAFQKIYCHARKNALPFYHKLNYKTVGDAFIEVGLEHYKLYKRLNN